MEEILYDEAVSNNKFRQSLLKFRGYLFEKMYLPHLKKAGLFKTPNAQYAEIGCGSGDKLIKILPVLPENAKIVGVDQSVYMLDAAAKKHPVCDYIEDDARSLETLENNYFDALFYFQVLHHLSLDDIQKAFQVAKEKLKEGGRIAIIDSLNRENIIQNTVFRFIEKEYATASIDDKAYQNCNRQHLLDIAEEQGFHLTYETGDRFPFILSEILIFDKNETTLSSHRSERDALRD